MPPARNFLKNGCLPSCWTPLPLAKFAALLTAMLLIALVPEIVLYVGSALVRSDPIGYLRDHLDLPGPMLASAMVTSLQVSTVALAIAALGALIGTGAGAWLGAERGAIEFGNLVGADDNAPGAVPLHCARFRRSEWDAAFGASGTMRAVADTLAARGLGDVLFVSELLGAVLLFIGFRLATTQQPIEAPPAPNPATTSA